MKNNQSPVDDLKHIRQMMEESSKFLSLSGLSGVAVGCFALIGAGVAHFWILEQGAIQYNQFLKVITGDYQKSVRLYLVLTALLVLTGAILSAWHISYRKSRKMNLKFWTPAARKMVMSMATVLGSGGIFCIILFFQGYFKILAASMLLFYGLALLNASRYSKHDIESLAYTQMGLGLLAAVFLNYGLIIWTIGFGLVHILYGILMYFKYERTPVV